MWANCNLNQKTIVIRANEFINQLKNDKNGRSNYNPGKYVLDDLRDYLPLFFHP